MAVEKVLYYHNQSFFEAWGTPSQVTFGYHKNGLMYYERWGACVIYYYMGGDTIYTWGGDIVSLEKFIHYAKISLPESQYEKLFERHGHD